MKHQDRLFKMVKEIEHSLECITRQHAELVALVTSGGRNEPLPPAYPTAIRRFDDGSVRISIMPDDAPATYITFSNIAEKLDFTARYDIHRDSYLNIACRLFPNSFSNEELKSLLKIARKIHADGVNNLTAVGLYDLIKENFEPMTI